MRIKRLFAVVALMAAVLLGIAGPASAGDGAYPPKPGGGGPVVVGPGTPGNGTLPRTGGNVAALYAGGGLVLAGGALIGATRRRARARS